MMSGAPWTFLVLLLLLLFATVLLLLCSSSNVQDFALRPPLRFSKSDEIIGAMLERSQSQSAPISSVKGFVSSSPDAISSPWLKWPQPVVGGGLGVCFDITMMEAPQIMQNKSNLGTSVNNIARANVLNGSLELRDSSLMFMWFSWRTQSTLGMTSSTNGVTWSPPKRINLPRGLGWAELWNRPSVVYEGGLFHLWVTGQSFRKRASVIGYARSPDGVNFELVSPLPVMSSLQQTWEATNVMCPHVLWDARRKLWRMWYSAGEFYEPNAIGYAESEDGVSWNRSALNPVFVPDKAFAWEVHKVTAAQIEIGADGWHYMFYIGFADEYSAAIGVARSRDGLTGWQRSTANPIVKPSPGGWDSEAVYKPFALVRDGSIYLYYNGRTKSIEQIGLAVHSGTQIPFPD